MTVAPGAPGPWPWWIIGPAMGLLVPALLLLGNKPFGVSGSFRVLCAACLPARVPFFRYDWKSAGTWSLVFLGGIVAGGLLAGITGGPFGALAEATREDLARLGIAYTGAAVPHELIGWRALLTARGMVTMLGGGFLVGFGSAYAGGCTSGHAIAGLANFQRASLIAVMSFFVAGALTSWFLLPLVVG